MRRALPLRRLRRDAAGATVVEFALVVPALVAVVLALFDMGYNMWALAMLQGSLQQAARSSTLEGAGGSATAIDGTVARRVHQLVPGAALTFTRKSYTNFGDVGVAEDFTDANGDGLCNDGEPFEDANGNGGWDSDRGTAGNGGARDAVLYTVTMRYPRAFPLASLVGLPGTISAEARTVLRNQPWRDQVVTVRVGHCA